MIAANELRIGNTLAFFSKQGIITGIISLISDEGILWFKHYDVKVDLEDVNGIPLTPEILEKAGFIDGRSHGFLWKIKGVSGFTIEKRAHRYYLKEYKVDANPIKTVHHLQNLFYAIKNEELKLEL